MRWLAQHRGDGLRVSLMKAAWNLSLKNEPAGPHGLVPPPRMGNKRQMLKNKNYSINYENKPKRWGWGLSPCCLLKFQGKKSTVDSWADCERPVSSAARSRRVLLRVCTLFSCSPAVGQRLLTFPRSHDCGCRQRGTAASAGLRCGQHWPFLLSLHSPPALTKK